ncbi:MAG: FHA domain-containing protein [Myxococcota bacterium]
MATVHSYRLGRFFLLPRVAVMGRDPSSDIVLPTPRASARHAEIRHQADGWDIRDLGSRNGTRLDGRPLTPGLHVPLRVGCEILLGDREERWRVVDVAPPGACLFDPETGDRIDPSDGRLGDDVFYDIEREAWCRHDEALPDGAQIGRFVLALPGADRMLTTQPALVELRRARLRIVASHDLDRIDVHLDDGATRVSFVDRAWAIALYVLGLHRHAHPDDGWMDVTQLARDCGLDRRVLDVYLLRAREAVVDAGVGSGEALIEVRRGIRRIGIANVAVEQEDG